MERVDLNTASAAELEALPGLGPVYARRIIEYRQKHGPFTDPAQIKEVQGIGEVLYAQLAELITVGTGERKTTPTDPAPSESPEVEEEMAEEVSPAEPTPPPPPQAPPPGEEGPWRWGPIGNWAVIVIGILAAAALALGVIYLYNATLDFSRHRDVVGLRSQACNLAQEQEAIRSELRDLTRWTERLEGRVQELEALRDDVEALREEMRGMRKEMEAEAVKPAQFKVFFPALGDLLRLEVECPLESTP